ncbi:MAG: hypothetical protein AAFU67_06640 [Bacteroidota bacterium]
MPEQDPLEELFRRNAGRMDQRPSLRSWRRLERRLDERRGRRNTQGPLRPWMYAAAAVLLICLAVLGLNDSNLATKNPLAQRPESIEELEQHTKQIVRTSPYLGIEEGKRGQILRVKNDKRPQLLPAEKYRI